MKPNEDDQELEDAQEAAVAAAKTAMKQKIISQVFHSIYFSYLAKIS